MAAGNHPVDKKVLKSLDPFENLCTDILDELAAKSTIEDIPVGRVLFRQGEKDKRLIYVMSGQVEVTATGKTKGKLIKAKTEEARHQSNIPCHVRVPQRPKRFARYSSLMAICWNS